VGAYLDKVLALADSLGAARHMAGYGRMRPAGMQAHLTSAHGMAPGDFGRDFSQPGSLGHWHAMDHVARGSLGHTHEAERSPSRAARSGIGSGSRDAERAEHGGGHALPRPHLPGISLLGAGLHREVRRESDRIVRRRAQREVHSHAEHHQGGAQATGSSSVFGGGGRTNTSSGSSQGGAGHRW